MTTIRQEFMKRPTVELGAESTLPLLYDANAGIRPGCKTETEEDDGLFCDFGNVRGAFPYRAQDNYTRAFTAEGLDTVVLENSHLRAVFVPSLGGKLWSLFDKDRQSELLFANPVFRPAYLALRNAWASGGVEWNLGYIGHSPRTCSPLFTALTHDGQTPVLRMYEFDRTRVLTYQMDFFLPDDSAFLYARMRIVNPCDHVVPVYWWSNIAVPTIPGARVISAADTVFVMQDGKLCHRSLPVYDGVTDVTYPENNKISIDHFMKTKDGRLRFVTQQSPQGYGLVQASTDRMKGRKLFVWGQGQGGKNFQAFLSGEGCRGEYCEIQAGLANTQFENLPMPAHTAWEWLEAYGPLSMCPADVNGAWGAAGEAAEHTLAANGITPDGLEALLKRTKAMATAPAERMLSVGSGFGALENLRRRKDGLPPLSEHLDFGAVGAEQDDFVCLLEKGHLPCPQDPCTVVPAWMLQDEWITRMEDAVRGADSDNWYAHLLLGCAHIMQGAGRLGEAQTELMRSLALLPNAWAEYALGELCRMAGQYESSCGYILNAARMNPRDASLAKICARHLFRCKAFDMLYEFTSGITDEAIRALPRIRYYRAFAKLRRGETEEAERLFAEGFEVPDMQEGEETYAEMYLDLQEARAAKEGCPFDRDQVRVPPQADFRMYR